MMTPAPVSAPPVSEPAAARSSWLDTATLVLLTTSWVYLTGWAYAWRFFSHVQLGLLALDIPKEYFFVYGLWVCQRWALLLVPVLLGMVGLTWYRRRHPASVWSSKAAVLIVAFVPVCAGIWPGGGVRERPLWAPTAAGFPRHATRAGVAQSLCQPGCPI